MRIVRIVVLLATLTALAAPGASALDFDESNFPLPEAIVGSPYTFQLKGSEGCVNSYKYRVILGELPAGITLSKSGLLSGTPTAAGEISFWLELADEGCNSTPSQALFTIRVKPKVTVTTSSLPAAAPGAPYSVSLTAEGWNPPLEWTLASGALPAGLSLSSDGIISGTPTTVGSSTFAVKASVLDGRADTKELTLRVLAPLAAVPPATTPRAEVGRRFTLTPAATGGLDPYTWSVATGSALPPGLTLDPTSGAISGIPTVSGSFTVELGLADANGSSTSIDLGITVVARLAIVTPSLKAAKVGRTYTQRVTVRGGVTPLKWKVVSGSLPPGIRLDRATSRLAGTPRKAGTYRFTIGVMDSIGVIATKPYVLRVAA